MDSRLTLGELESRLKRTLTATQTAAAMHPEAYRELKNQAVAIVENPIDINDYFPMVEILVNRLRAMDPGGHGSIFDIFRARISPSNIWQVKLLRMECKDLLAHLDEFDRWRRKKSHLRRVK